MINGKTLISILNKIILLLQSIGILILSLLKIIRLKYYILSEIGNTGTKDKLESDLIISEAMDDVYVRDDFKFMLDEIEITKRGLF